MESGNEFSYVGGELAIFAHAQHWKRYWRSKVSPHIRGDVLEVGAGIGANTELLRDGEKSWTCLEPDGALAQELRSKTNARIVEGTLESLPPTEMFDSILYIDVLEHIADDSAELARAAVRLRTGGHIVVLSPAHPWLFSPFDKAIGHCRRYTRASLLALTPQALRVVKCFYLDAVGLFASLANRMLLKQSMPTLNQILTWDRLMVPTSRVVDPLMFYRFGKTVIAIWEKP
jgi:SAM-dependent methyltransferase